MCGRSAGAFYNVGNGHEITPSACAGRITSPHVRQHRSRARGGRRGKVLDDCQRSRCRGAAGLERAGPRLPLRAGAAERARERAAGRSRLRVQQPQQRHHVVAQQLAQLVLDQRRLVALPRAAPHTPCLPLAAFHTPQDCHLTEGSCPRRNLPLFTPSTALMRACAVTSPPDPRK